MVSIEVGDHMDTHLWTAKAAGSWRPSARRRRATGTLQHVEEVTGNVAETATVLVSPGKDRDMGC